MSRPRLRFSEFSDEWRIEALSNISNFQEGPGILAVDFKDRGVPLIRLSGLSGSKVSLEGCNYLDQEKVEHKWSHFRLQKGDLLISASATLGSISEVDERTEGAVAYTGIIRFRPAIHVTTGDYLKHILASDKFKKQTKAMSTGATIHHFGPSHLKLVRLLIPRKPEQEKIAEFLTAVDERILLIEEKVKLLKKYKKSVMQKIFTQQIRFKDERGNFYNDWENKKVEDLYMFRWTNSLSRDNLSDEVGEYKNIHYGDIHTKYQGRLDTTDSNVRIPYVKTGPKLIIDKYLPTSILEEKDIVMADASEDYKDVGKSLEIAKTEGRTVAGLHTIAMRPYEDFALGFGAYLFNSSQVHKQIARLATGVSVLGISRSNLSKVLLPMPCVDEQRKITDFLVAVDDKIKLEEAKLEKAKEFKKSLLQRMFV